MWSRTEEACKQRVIELERHAQYAPVHTQTQIDEVIKGEANVDALLNNFEPLWADINRRLTILKLLHGNRRLKDDDMGRVSSAIKHELATDYAAVDAWRRAIDELARDADAELPQ